MFNQSENVETNRIRIHLKHIQLTRIFRSTRFTEVSGWEKSAR